MAFKLTQSKLYLSYSVASLFPTASCHRCESYCEQYHAGRRLRNGGKANNFEVVDFKLVVAKFCKVRNDDLDLRLIVKR